MLCIVEFDLAVMRMTHIEVSGLGIQKFHGMQGDQVQSYRDIEFDHIKILQQPVDLEVQMTTKH